MRRVQLTDAQQRLSALIDAAMRGEDVVITRNEVPVARLSAISPLPSQVQPSLRDHEAISVGHIRNPLTSSDDLLAEMLDDRG